MSLSIRISKILNKAQSGKEMTKTKVHNVAPGSHFTGRNARTTESIFVIAVFDHDQTRSDQVGSPVAHDCLFLAGLAGSKPVHP